MGIRGGDLMEGWKKALLVAGAAGDQRWVKHGETVGQPSTINGLTMRYTMVYYG